MSNMKMKMENGIVQFVTLSTWGLARAQLRAQGAQDDPTSPNWTQGPPKWPPAVCTGIHGFLATSTGKIVKSPEKSSIFLCFSKVFQAHILRKYPRRPSASSWYHLELRRPKFDRFRHFFSIFVSFFWPAKYENPTCSLYFWKNRPWNDARDLDLAICYTEKRITALYDQIWPTWTLPKTREFPYKRPGAIYETRTDDLQYHALHEVNWTFAKQFARWDFCPHHPLFHIDFRAWTVTSQAEPMRKHMAPSRLYRKSQVFG